MRAVWNAWVDPELVMKWWGPYRFTCPSADMHFHEGGTPLVCTRAPEEFGGQDIYSTWTYTKIVPMKRIAYIHNLADKSGSRVDPVKMGMPPDFPQDQLHVIVFNELSDAKTEVSVTEFGWTIGQMMDFSKMGMEQCLDKMARALSKTRKK
ncbi:MAG: SRPBCC family protein [Nitrososphaerales archaeon]